MANSIFELLREMPVENLHFLQTHNAKTRLKLRTHFGHGTTPVLPIASAITQPLRSFCSSLTTVSQIHNLMNYLARAQKQNRDNGQWKNIKGQTQSVSALDGDEWSVIHRLPSHLRALHRGCSLLNCNDD